MKKCFTYSIGHSKLIITKRSWKNPSEKREDPGVVIVRRDHPLDYLEGWIIVKTNNSKVIYENIAKWGKLLNSETTSVFADEEVALIVVKFMDEKFKPWIQQFD